VREEGSELIEWELPSQGLPVGEYDAVMVFGGDQNVGEELRYPWLHDEYELLRGWVAAGTPLLGVCLGAQTLAHATGALVARARELQIGFYDTELTAEGAGDLVLGALPRRFEALNANGFRFDVPPGGVELACAGGAPQAFRLGARAWGVQFHPEVRRDQVLAWFAGEPGLPRPFDELEAEIDAGIERWHELGRRLCSAFLTVAASQVSSGRSS